ncbi:MAG: 16S rRNA (uracil(1498)-N(3))-methyltransferase, partial [Betaproteobacteria bacterium]|nr:16S rRNA (uracil(1498)-N(3))-methyltransferase [Betaproteobacteria bacterium]
MNRRANRRHQARLLVPRLAQPEGQAFDADHLSLERDQAHHLSRVLRLEVGEQLELLSGDGHCYWSTIESMSRDSVTLSIEAHCFVPPSSLQIVLIQGLSAADNMDFSLQKGVELGLNAFMPIHCERSVSRIDASRAANKIRHWQMVAQAACMQSANPWLPCIHQPQDLAVALGGMVANKSGPKITGSGMLAYHWVLDPYANQSLIELLSSQSGVSTPNPAPEPVGDILVRLLVGPEAGLSEQEVNVAKQADFQPVHLGPRTLRTET